MRARAVDDVAQRPLGVLEAAAAHRSAAIEDDHQIRGHGAHGLGECRCSDLDQHRRVVGGSEVPGHPGEAVPVEASVEFHSRLLSSRLVQAA